MKKINIWKQKIYSDFQGRAKGGGAVKYPDLYSKLKIVLNHFIAFINDAWTNKWIKYVKLNLKYVQLPDI